MGQLISIHDGYSSDGFAIVPAYTEKEFASIREFARSWLTGLFRSFGVPEDPRYSLETYHRWGEELAVPHGEIFRAFRRHRVPPDELKSVILNDRLRDALREAGIEKFDLWDEGLGWLAFRFVRPNRGDGYPLSCKAWGPAKSVISFSLPIIGFTPAQSMGFVRGSQSKEYPKILPQSSKFCADEFRLDPAFTSFELYRPAMRPGDVLFFHPQVLHTEDVTEGDVTRFSLEFRVTKA